MAIAVALSTRPAILLADEPTGELDGATAEVVLGILRDAVRAEGVTCIVVTHDEAVERIADRVVYLADGRAVAERRGGDGIAPDRATDAQGWLAPPLPARGEPLSAAERPAQRRGRGRPRGRGPDLRPGGPRDARPAAHERARSGAAGCTS